MQIHVMLTVDLNGHVSADARARFNESLKSKKWQKTSLTTIWTAWFKEGVTSEQALAETKIDVAAAAKDAGIWNYEACALPSYQALTTWNSKASSLLGA